MRRVGWMCLLVPLRFWIGQGQENSDRPVVLTVSYITTQSVYLNGGTNNFIAVGDTGVLHRSGQRAGTVLVTGVSSSSCSARLMTSTDSVAIGDSVVFASRSLTTPTVMQGPVTGEVSRRSRFATSAPGNAIHGRVSIQYTGAGEVGGVPSLSRPSLLVYLSALPKDGSGLSLTLNGRLDGSLGATHTSWSGQGTTLRLYSLSLELDDVRRWGGFSLGRITSAYVGGLGLVDGAQAVVRWKSLTVGGLAGFQPDYRTSGFSDQTQKFSGFLNVAWAGSATLRGNSTIAYGQQLFKGKLDRDFMYLQNTAAVSSALFFYQSTEIDLHRQEGEQRTGEFRLTNTFVTVNYQPRNWLSMNLGYDASRRIEFLETEKNIVDSLLDRDLRQGFRGGVHVRFPLNIALSLRGGYRLPAGGLSSGYSAGGGVRIANIGGSGISTAGQYVHVQGPYTIGDDIAGEVEYSPISAVVFSLQWNEYAFVPSSAMAAAGKSSVSTVTGSIVWNTTHGWYFTVFADRILDNSAILYRCFAEAGFHF